MDILLQLFYAIETIQLCYGVFGCINCAYAAMLCYAATPCMPSNSLYTGRRKAKNQIYIARTPQSIISTYVYIHVQ